MNQLRLLALSIASLSLAATALSCGPTASPKPAPDLAHVTEWKPGDELQRLDASLRVTFNRPMVGVDAVGPALQTLPVQVEPALPLRAHWDDRKTLIVRPETEWKAGQHYVLTLTGELGASTAEPHGFAFDAQPLRLSWLTLSGGNVELEPQFGANFNLAVDAQQAIAACALVSDDGKRVGLVASTTVVSDADRDTHRVLFGVRERLAMQTRYVLDCKGLAPLGGNALFRIDPKAAGFTTHGPLTLGAGMPAGGQALPPERAQLCLPFTTPVSNEQLARHVHVSPQIDGLGAGWYERACDDNWVATHRANSVLLPPRREFRVTVDAELTDVFGQRLGRAQQWSFKTTDRVPGLWTVTGVGAVLEYGRKGHAVGTLNLEHAQLTCASLSPQQFASGFDRFSGWAFESAEIAPKDRVKAPWELLGVEPRAQTLAIDAAPNEGRVLPIDLGARCGRGPGAQGLYVLEIAPDAKSVAALGRQGDAPARLVANVTDLALVAKRGAGSALVWVTRLSNGALVAGAQVSALDAHGRVLASARTDANGLCRFARLPPSTESEFFAVQSGADVAIVGTHWLWRDGLQSWQLNVRDEGDDNATRLFVHTDRGVYRPGERVLVHGLVRRISDTTPARVPSERRVSLVLEAGAEVVYQRTLELSDYGSFSAEIDLPAHIPLGWHSLRVDVAGKQESYAINVAEFRPATFEITGGPKQDELLAPAAVQVDVAMRYLFGSPVANAPLHWTVERTPATISAPDFEQFRFEDSAPALPNEEPWPEAPSGLLLQRADKTTAQGGAQLTFATEASRRPTRYLITAEGTDAGEDRASRSVSVLAHSGDVYVGTRMTRWVFGAGESIQAELVLVDRAGKQVAGQATVELRDEHWDCKDLLRGCTVEVRSLETQQVSVGLGKPTQVTFAAKGTGSIHVRAETSDAAGRRARASDSAWVWSDSSEGPYEDRVAVPLNVDKRAYRVGDRARLALQTQHTPQHLLVTTERADVLSADVVARAAGMPSVALGPVAAPNAFITVTGMMPRGVDGEAGAPRLVSGAREVKVEGPTRKLEARIELAREAYRPHERIEGDVIVAHRGKPVEAEVALVVVNESVLQLTAFETPDPTRVFHAPRGLSVRSASNITRVVADPNKAALVPEVARAGVEGEDGGGGRPELRDDYVAAAYFAPALRTDRNGRVHFAFDAPGDLSAYRVMVVVAAKDDRVGSADARLRVQQPLSVHPLAPRFLSRGDTLEIGALVHDSTGVAGATDVDFKAQGLTLASAHAQASGAAAEQVVRTQATVQDVDRATFELAVHKGAENDRVGRDLFVRRPLDTELRVLALQRAPKTAARLDWPKGIDPSLSQLEITVDRVGLAPLAPVLATVVNYPYGCTEQTAAALLALAAVPELARAVLPGLDTEARLHARIADGVGRLLQARADDGGFALYPGMNGRPWLSAIVLDAALAVRRAGMTVPDVLVDAAKISLANWLGNANVRELTPGELEFAAQSVLLLAQTGAPIDTLEEQLWQQRARLTIDADTYLLRTWAQRNTHEDRRVLIRDQLRATSWLARTRDPEAPLSSAERTTALALTSLLEDAHEPQLAQKLAQWLIARATDPEVYLSTRDIADTLAALSAWARAQQAGASQVKLGLGKQVLWQGTLNGAQVVAVQRSASQAASGSDAWVEADGEVSVSIRRRDISPTREKVAFSRGLSLNRSYTDPKTGKPLGTLALGDIVQVEVELHTDRSLRMLALTDPLPSGLEPLDPGLSTGRLAGCDACEDTGGFDHVRRHDDRIEGFAEWLPPGKHVMRYLLRATTPGTFSAPGASATLMYMPDYFARSSVGSVGVK